MSEPGGFVVEPLATLCTPLVSIVGAWAAAAAAKTVAKATLRNDRMTLPFFVIQVWGARLRGKNLLLRSVCKIAYFRQCAGNFRVSTIVQVCSARGLGSRFLHAPAGA